MLVGRIIAAERADIVERPRLAAHDPIAAGEIRICRRIGLGFEDGLIETWRQGVDQIDVARELGVLLSRYAGGHEDAEMADALVDRIDDGLPISADLVDVVVE